MPVSLAVALAQAPNAPAIASDAATELGQGKLVDFYLRLDADMTRAMTAADFAKLVNSDLLASAGEFEKIESAPSCKAASSVQICEVPLLFKQAHVRLRLVVNDQGRIAGLFKLSRDPR